MVDATNEKGPATGPEEVKKATGDARKASVAADEKAKDVAEKREGPGADKRASGETGSSGSASAEVAKPARASRGKSAAGKEKVEAKEAAGSVTAETPENREANKAPKVEGVQPEYVMNEEAKKNRRPGPEEDLRNKAFPDPATGTHPAPLEKDADDARLEARPVNALDYRDRHAALQEDQQWIINREQAKVTTSETPAGDSSAAPEANESANWVDTPARAHTLSEPDGDNTADSVGQRLRRAAESAQLETRPHQKGITSGSDSLPGSYTVEEELRLQWPGIELGDSKE